MHVVNCGSINACRGGKWAPRWCDGFSAVERWVSAVKGRCTMHDARHGAFSITLAELEFSWSKRVLGCMVLDRYVFGDSGEKGHVPTVCVFQTVKIYFGFDTYETHRIVLLCIWCWVKRHIRFLDAILECSEQTHACLLSLFLVLGKETHIRVLCEFLECAEQTYVHVLLFLLYLC